MHRIIYPVLLLSLCAACSKEHTPAVTPPHTSTPTHAAPVSKISCFINGDTLTVKSIDYNRSSSTFNFSAQNAFEKIDVRCFWFIQYGKYSFQYSDSVNYAYRQDSLSEWTTVRADNYGNVFFDCCTAPLTDHIISGNFDGVCRYENKKAKIRGSFYLVFQ